MYRFHDSKVDADLFMQLQDLAAVLSGVPEMEFEHSYGSYIDMTQKKITASRFWDKLPADRKKAGLKSEVLLRAIGTMLLSDIQVLKEYKAESKHSRLPKFASQLVALFEDVRLEELIKRSRPGSKKLFDVRRNFLRNYFENQLATNITRGFPLDELFCMIYLTLQAETPSLQFPRSNGPQLDSLEKIKPEIFSLFDARSTNDTALLAEKIAFRLSDHYEDTINEYFVFPVAQIEGYESNTLFDELTRTDELVNDDIQETDEEKNEYFDEKFSTWHRENKNEDRKQNFLQFDLEQGTKTDILGGGARETEDADQALASIQGASGESKSKDYSEMEALDKEQDKARPGGESSYGEDNRDAVKQYKYAATPQPAEEGTYYDYAGEIEAYKRKLANTLKRTIEHKKSSPRRDLLMGRLSKKLLPAITEESRRIFYKKDLESKEFDAVFTLLIDCSASMAGKMEETKKGVVLFHEVLKQLQIPHSIVGFWEDANEVRENYQPNYFHVIHSFSDSLHENNGPKIMQLQAEEDNRDGFSIRVITEGLVARREENKFLLVFSDGEPAAAGYDQNGIVDTHNAVSEARKKGIEVIGMFLADGEISEREQSIMENIYGREHLLIPSVSELPEHFAPILKKLLLKAI